ncbi:MAG: leucine-rich repeat domain-containing protein [Tannerella sp.]|jgi:hypothetical protein|nr:leucine-rich repeat domain-containing protein [Tannerella sp.]
MKKELPKRQACNACILIPLMLCFLLATPSLWATTRTIDKTTSPISIPAYSLEDTLVITGNALATADWTTLRNLTTGYNLVLETADVNIPGSALLTCSGILSVSSSTITTIGNAAFGNCTKLTNADFPNVTDIGNYAFQVCSKLANVSFPNAIFIGDYAFLDCIVLTTGSFPNVTSIGNSAFNRCLLTTASFPKAINIGTGAFGNCPELVNADFPNAPTTGLYTFQVCGKLTNVSFPKAGIIDNGAFYNCTSLVNASFPEAVNIKDQAFQLCSKLTNVSIPNVTKIGYYAFGGCTSLTNVSFPILTYIGNEAFAFCINLASLTLGNTPPTLGTTPFNGVSPLLLVVPDSTTYTPVPAGFPTGTEAFNKSVPTQQDALAYGKPYDLVPNRIPTLPGGYYQWEKDGVTIPGATGSTYQATTPGLYTLQYIHGEQVTLLSIYLAATPYDLYGTYNRYQGCEYVLQLTFTQPTTARTIEVWSEGTGATGLYDTQSGKYFNDTLTYKLASGDSLLTIPYAIDEDVQDGSHATFAYRIAPAGTIERTDEFILYAKPDIKLIKYYPTTSQFKGVLDISITNSSYYMQRSLDDGQSWQFARDTVTGEVLPFSQSQIAGFIPGTTILFRVPNGCSYDTLTVGNKDDDDPYITRQVTMPSVPDAICSVAPGTYYVNSGDNFIFTITPTGSNTGKIPQVSTSRTRLPDSEGVVTTDNGDSSYTVTILQIQESITITIDFATGNGLIDTGNRIWSYDGQLYITTTVSGTATVYSAMGSLVKTISISTGETVGTTLPTGIYIVSMNGKTYKVMVNY